MAGCERRVKLGIGESQNVSRGLSEPVRYHDSAVVSHGDEATVESRVQAWSNSWGRVFERWKARRTRRCSAGRLVTIRAATASVGRRVLAVVPMSSAAATLLWESAARNSA